MKARFNRTFIALCLTFLVGCGAEDPFTASDHDDSEDLRTQVVLSLAMPAIDLPTATRASIMDESAIKNVTVFVFDNEDLFLYEVAKKHIEIRDGYIYVQLLENKENVNLSIITNVKEGVSVPAIGTPKVDAVKNILFRADNTSTTIPMYGECRLDKGVQAGTRGVVVLKRAMAKISIDASLVKGLLQISEVRLLNFNAEGSVCGEGERSSQESQMVFGEIADNKFTFYVPEVDNLFKADRTSIVLTTKYKGENNYYRLDFIVRNGSNVTSILRNHIYSFNITNVGGTGFSRLSDAMNFNNPASNAVKGMAVDLLITDETIMDITTDGTYYLGVTRSEIVAGKNSSCYFANFSIVTNNPNGWEILELPSGVDVSLPSFKNGDMVVSKSVWIYIDPTGEISADRKVDVFVFSANIRKRIQVTLPNE